MFLVLMLRWFSWDERVISFSTLSCLRESLIIDLSNLELLLHLYKLPLKINMWIWGIINSNSCLNSFVIPIGIRNWLRIDMA